MRQGDLYQISMISLGVVATGLLGYFLYNELFPEYRIYQEDYVALEEFRSTYTGQPVPDFRMGVKQIVLLRDDKGPPVIDRCTSCHVALQFEHFSPTKIAYDINGQLQLDVNGIPVQIPNDQYVWARLDAKILELKKSGNESLANEYESLKTAHVGEHIYDVTKVLRMHPLMGRETRPFEFHPIDEYGCVSCHNGNGRGLTTEKAHGPVFDDQYETEFMGYKPSFLETDPKNDPPFSKVFNDKPGHNLLFQTSPIYVGALMQAKCVQCHQTSSGALLGAVDAADLVASRREQHVSAVENSLIREMEAAASLKALNHSLVSQGYSKTVEQYDKKTKDYSLEPREIETAHSLVEFLKSNGDASAKKIQEQLLALLGSQQLVNDYVASKESLEKFLEKNPADKSNKGTLYQKQKQVQLEKTLMGLSKENKNIWTSTLTNESAFNALPTAVDLLTQNYQRGRGLYISQACYACHRIAGLARGGVGPELTREGYSYPWFVKESIVWPQADLKTSTMPNYHLDHKELEDLLTFLLAQTGETKAVSSNAYKIAIQEWENGKKLPWEKPVTPTQIQDLNYSMTVFATEGCAACHRLSGFNSDVGYAVETQKKDDFDALYKEKEWFRNLIPETIIGSELAAVVEKNASEIDRRIVHDARENGILNTIEVNSPDTIESYYTNFRFASRVHEDADWKERLHRVLMMYIQEYGLGRLVGPRPNWSGVYRTDEWLMEHFKNPSSHVPRSIMPVFPFDDTKFYALTHMLDVLGIRNRNVDKEIWNHKGFNPEAAYQHYCSQCHGSNLHGNGPVAEWIYPVPKNLRNSDFLHQLTRERAIQSITHGVKGTPMPPWGEVASDKSTYDKIPVLSADEIHQLVDWIYAGLPGGQVYRSTEDVDKWKYSPEDVLKDLRNEGNYERFKKSENKSNLSIPGGQALLAPLQKYGHCYAALDPKVVSSAETTKKGIVDQENEIFDITAPPVPGVDSYGYYIKKEYYTPENINAGREFFELNCAACHGKDADGSGLRAGAMQEAKPRMLVNLDWINTRDDLRLIRSIKFGVPGTAMNPWGDLTNSLQRLQLVMFIRTLSEDKRENRLIEDPLYQVFDRGDQQIEQVRAAEYKALDSTQKALSEVQKKKRALYAQVVDGEQPPKELLTIVPQELELIGKLNSLKDKDNLLVELKSNLKSEKELYASLGYSIIQLHPGDLVLNDFSGLVTSLQPRFKIEDGTVRYLLNETNEATAEKYNQKLLDWIQSKLAAYENKKTIAEGMISSMEKRELLSTIQNDVSSYKKLQKKLLSTLAEGRRLREKQHNLINTYNAKNKS